MISRDKSTWPNSSTVLVLLHVFLMSYSLSLRAQEHYLLEAESFNNKGGWAVDQQFFELMGSSYLLAHGLGEPVADASTEVSLPGKGKYYVWVRTKDWAPFPKGPGTFKLVIDDVELDVVFGSTGVAGWQWYTGGEVKVNSPTVRVTLHDQSGFEGRCDAIWFAKSAKFKPPNDLKELEKWRNELLNIPENTEEAGPFDLVVIGGGMAGTCAAITAARSGLKTALVQNRPVLGGNNSSDVRVHLMGDTDKNFYPKLGRVVRELDNGDPGNGHPDGKSYGDKRKLDVVRAEGNLHVFLNMHAYKVNKEGNRIISVVARHVEENRDILFKGRLFSDCTGDGTIAFLAGADYRMGRESRSETNEPLAPEEADEFTLGTSNLWASVEKDVISSFPETPWALQFSEEYFIDEPKSDWQWETGFGNFNTIFDAEELRDHNFRAIYGNWSFLKNKMPEKYAKNKMVWAAYIGGKRESRRIMGDYVLSQMDVQGDNGHQPDGFVTATWTIDLHFPNEKNSRYFKGQEFFASTEHIKVAPYTIPYRCLYSRNIENLYMAGRNISTTHVAFGSTRVMRTCGMMGEVVGYAASLAVKYNLSPRGVYEQKLDQLVSIIKE
ncbi:MAG: FAD-dependent oxidoreductase [Cyclobacteriaceae bacterium]|nr:FAD-dependent oxidoreductase [Cyclobacteriaceae bacterium]